MASRIQITVQTVLIAGWLVGGLAAQTRYVPDKVGSWTLERHDYSGGMGRSGLSPAEKSRFDAKIGALISAIQESKTFSPPMGIEPHAYRNYVAPDEPDQCESQPCIHHPPVFSLDIFLWYYLLTEKGMGLQKFVENESVG